MISIPSNDLVSRSKALYAQRWQNELELNHHGAYLAIEPESQRYFLADNYSDAISAANEAEPERLVFVMRVGHRAAIHLGGYSS